MILTINDLRRGRASEARDRVMEGEGKRDEGYDQGYGIDEVEFCSQIARGAGFKRGTLHYKSYCLSSRIRMVQ